MKKFFWIALLMMNASCATDLLPTDTLLPSAKISVTKKGVDGSSGEACAEFNPTEKEIRNMLQHYRRLDSRELHRSYLWASCFVEGTIEQSGKTFKFRARAGNTLETDFPGGSEVILGGRRSDSP